jgi:hypothetical protein
VCQILRVGTGARGRGGPGLSPWRVLEPFPARRGASTATSRRCLAWRPRARAPGRRAPLSQPAPLASLPNAAASPAQGDRAIPKQLFDADGGLEERYIFCARCGKNTADDDNDIVLCDGPCNRWRGGSG